MASRSTERHAARRALCPTEREEQRMLARWLNLRSPRILWCHPANEGMGNVAHRVAQRRDGLMPGVPDILIFSHPTSASVRGVAIELKRERGSICLRPAQKAWLDGLASNGWLVSVQRGAGAAIAWLRELGY